MKQLIRSTVVITLFIFIAGSFFLSDKHSSQNNGSVHRFIAYDNGTVLDTGTGLMWAAHDNGAPATWKEAKEYCEGYRGGGYTDWRMPTAEELAMLYDEDEPGYRPKCAVYDWKVFLTDKIRLTGGSAWASADYGNEAECFMFDYGCRSRMFKSVNFIMRPLPVRSSSLK